MKGLDVEHGQGAFDDTSCQQSVDAKAFKGRGAQRALLDARAAVDKVHAEMAELVKLTQAVPGKLVRLCIHRRQGTGQASLRWRAVGVDAVHLAWDEMEERFAAQGPQVAGWYRKVDRLARELNEREKRARAGLKSSQVLAQPAGTRCMRRAV
jgi:hypothetical protein